MIESMPKQSEEWSIAKQHFMDGYNTARKELEHLGWHPATEPPKEGDEVIVITLGSAAAARAIYLNGIYYSVVINRTKAYYPSVEWWCYPPEKED